MIAARKLVAALEAEPPPPAAAAEPAPEAARPHAARSIPNPVYEQIRMQLFEQEAVLASLQRQIADGTKERDRLEEIARGVPGLQAEYTNLNRDYDVLHKNYTELLSRRESMRIAAAADNDAEKVKMQIIDPPQVPQIPVAPKRAAAAVRRAGGGPGAGLGLAHPAAAVRPVVPLHRGSARPRPARGRRHLAAGRHRADARAG